MSHCCRRICLYRICRNMVVAFAISLGSDGHGSCFVAIVAGMRWIWLLRLPFRGLAMDMVHVELLLQDSCVAIYAKSFSFSCSIFAFALFVVGEDQECRTCRRSPDCCKE